MNSRTKAQQADHREATRICAGLPCLVCFAWGCEPAHWPVHRGMGGGKAGWSRDEYVPLCRECHDKADGRNGVSEKRAAETQRVRAVIAERAPVFWGQAA